MKYKNDNSENIYKIIEKAGGATAVACACEMERTSVYKWIYNGWIPPRRVRILSCLSGISCNAIDPINFPKENPSHRE